MITRALLNLSTIQVVLFGSVLSRDKFAREPSNQIARIGDEVLFACKLTSQRSNVQWTRNGFGLGFGRDLLGFSRYSIIGSSAE
ncbi:irregular chiasm C-roughest protein, partial [Eurytemora carolleeae]|uniref:irregular chiasm C-roughest protein n=1 Tax=Eurytemora carolleeae TaxID=1294199 RepID=UPI000C787E7C